MRTLIGVTLIRRLAYVDFEHDLQMGWSQMILYKYESLFLKINYEGSLSAGLTASY